MAGKAPEADVRIFAGTPRYYQGPDALDSLPEICAGLAALPAVVVDADVLALLGTRLAEPDSATLAAHVAQAPAGAYLIVPYSAAEIVAAMQTVERRFARLAVERIMP